MTEEFIGILEELLGIFHTRISLKEEWIRSAPGRFMGNTYNGLSQQRK